MTLATYQIIYIDSLQARLYGELIQTIEERGTCWVRPLFLIFKTETFEADTSLDIDLRNGPDIVCANTFVKPALDTDWLPFVGKLQEAKNACDYRQANQHLRDFLETLVNT